MTDCSAEDQLESDCPYKEPTGSGRCNDSIAGMAIAEVAASAEVNVSIWLGAFRR